MRHTIAVSLVAFVAAPTTVAAQADTGENTAVTATAPVPATGESDADADARASDTAPIVVIARRYRGAVDTPEPPVVELGEEDIAAYGAASLDELISLLSPETGSGRGRGDGRPLFLLNGQRVSSFRELRDIPPEALLRVQVLPEEVALRYGFPPNQRVVNFILKDKYASRTVNTEYDLPTLGGFSEGDADASLFKVAGPSRVNVTGRYESTSLLTEAERGVVQDPADEPSVGGDGLDLGAFRSLIASSRSYSLNGNVATGLGAKGRDGQRLGGSLSLNGAYTHEDTRALSGIDTASLADPAGPGALARETHADTAQSGITLNRNLGGWLLTGTVDGSYAETETLIDRPAAAASGLGRDTARERDITASSLLTLAGNALRLPAGRGQATLKAGYAFADTRASGAGSAADPAGFRRGDLSAGINLALPLTSRREHVLGAVGDLTLNLSAGIDHLSDFGTLTDWTTGLTWNVTSRLGLQASYIVNQAAPSLAQLGAPDVLAYNVTVFDFSRSENAIVTVTTGGNPDLVKEKQRDLKLSANWTLPFLANRSNLIVEYFRNRSTDVTEAFPLLTPAIEAAFPGRVTRDADGRLIAIDRRPVTFDEIASSRMRWGLNLSGAFGRKSADQGGEAGGNGAPPPGGPSPGAPPPGGGSGFGGPGGGGMGGPGGGLFGGRRNASGGRWNFGVYHTWNFTDTVTVSPGGPVLDLLHGDAITAGGVARHQVEFEGGGFYKGFGVRLNGTWSAPVRVTASGAPGTSDLRFGSVFAIDLRLFADLGRVPGLAAKAPFLKGARLLFRVENLLDSRQKVTDPANLTPLAYQKDYLDPRGRVIGIGLRKMF